jgi:transcriptional regulator with XRE-family HTH domain
VTARSAGLQEGLDDPAAYVRTFGLALHLQRVKRGMSQEAFAELVGLHRTFYGAVERGERGCNIDKLPAIARGLGCQPGELLPPLPEQAMSAAPPRREI